MKDIKLTEEERENFKKSLKNVLEPQMSTIGDKFLLNILTGIYITNGLLFYIAGLWTFRLFQPLKVLQ